MGTRRLAATTLAIAVAVFAVLAAVPGALMAEPGRFPNVVEALKSAPGCLGVETAQTFDRQPLPDLAEDSGAILAIVSVKFVEGTTPDPASRRMDSIGIELYGPLPGGIAVGGRFAPEAVKVRGLREIDLTTTRPR